MGQFYNIFILMVFFPSVFGEEDYCSVHPGHVLCDENRSGYSKCPEQVSSHNLTQTERQEVIETINELRSKVARGDMEWNKSSTTTQAANMMMVQWDDELALAAASIAARCSDEEPCSECLLLERFPMKFIQKTFPVGIAMKPLPLGIYLNQTIQEGVETSNDFQISLDKIPPIDHLLWAETFLIGCGSVIYPNNGSVIHRIVCGFGPVGPVSEKQVYQPGTPCSDCPFGSQCSEIFPSLCECKNNRCNMFENSARARRAATTQAGPTAAGTGSGTGAGANQPTTPSSGDSGKTEAGGAEGVSNAAPQGGDSSADDGDLSNTYEDGDSSDSSRPIAYSLPMHILYVLMVASIFKF